MLYIILNYNVKITISILIIAASCRRYHRIHVPTRILDCVENLECSNFKSSSLQIHAPILLGEYFKHHHVNMVQLGTDTIVNRRE